MYYGKGMPKFSLMILWRQKSGFSRSVCAEREPRKAKSPELRGPARRSRCPAILSANEAFCEINYVRTQARQFTYENAHQTKSSAAIRRHARRQSRTRWNQRVSARSSNRRHQGQRQRHRIYDETVFPYRLVVQGPGAGADVTAMGVFSDILKLLNYLPH
jgi:hypothetical protein